jgi:hypothetical protein
VVLTPNFPLSFVTIVAVSPSDADIVAFATSDQRLFLSTNATAATPTWSEATVSKPASLQMASIAIDSANNTFVLLADSVATGGGDFETISPLFYISANTWFQITCTNLPNSGGYGKLLADPVQSNTLYAANNARVYGLSSDGLGSTTNWTDISNGLPGQWIYDLWVGNIGSATTPKVLLRAAVPTRGVWELDVTAGSADTALELYMRDNFLDLGRLPRSPNGVPNPHNPAETLYHYQCADIKVDAQQQGTVNGQTITFFQTDPEGSLPLSHVLFDQLKDNSDNLPSADQANVYVQVRNRGLSTANNVWVWVIYANAGAGLPALNISASSGNNFDFWSQFSLSGINPSLPSDSPWQQVGNPVLLSGIDPSHPQVASWSWMVPTLGFGDPGHYCLAAFVQSSGSQINETGFDVDDITPTNKQVGQKNLHIGPPLPSIGGPDGRGAPGDGRPMLEYIEFYNPTSSIRTTTLVFDLQSLPPQLVISFVLTPLKTINPLPVSITGVISTSSEPGTLGPGCDHHHKHKHCHHHHHHHHGCHDDDHNHDHSCQCTNITPYASCQLLKCKSCHSAHPPKTCPCKKFFSQFTPIIYTASPSSLVSISGVQIPGYGFVAAYFSVTNTGTLPEGQQYRFNVQQFLERRLVGESTYVVRIAGAAPFNPFTPPDGDGDATAPPPPVWIQEYRK